MTKLDPTLYVNVTLPTLSRPGEWHIIPPEYTPFRVIEDQNNEKIFLPVINLKDNGGKPDGTIAVLEIDLMN